VKSGRNLRAREARCILLSRSTHPMLRKNSPAWGWQCSSAWAKILGGDVLENEASPWPLRKKGLRRTMADEEDEQDEQEAPEPRLFTITEAERTRREVEPVLIEAIELRKKLAPLVEELGAISARIQWVGGSVVPYEKTARLRFEHDKLAESLKASLEHIQSTGCLIKDLDTGLLDFPAIINNEEVYLCWRLGEERIRFWHRQNEGFAGRKPLDPGDTGPNNPVQ
jgi:hypothetical protein